MSKIHSYIVSNIQEYQSRIDTLEKDGICLCKNDTLAIMSPEIMERKLLEITPNNRWVSKFREIASRLNTVNNGIDLFTKTIIDICIPANEKDTMFVTIGDVASSMGKHIIGETVTCKYTY